MPKSLFSQRHDRLRELLIAARQRAGLRQVDVAASLGRPQSFVSKYEAGERQLDVIEFIDVAQAIKASASELILELASATVAAKRESSKRSAK
ncbi:MAG: helix-turn-helix protein [Phycisphaerales bacterium]|nr:helix-turn-helix protein [Phycisphaerales bacterium]